MFNIKIEYDFFKFYNFLDNYLFHNKLIRNKIIIYYKASFLVD